MSALEVTRLPQGVISQLLDVATTLYNKGWAENHAGNISFNISDQELQSLDLELYDQGEDIALEGYPVLAGRLFLVTAAGSAFRTLAQLWESQLGIIRVSEDGTSYRKIWGFAGGTLRPTSELPAHLRTHAERLANYADTKVVLHAHPTHVVALTHVHPDDEIVLTKRLWATNSESILAFPEGVGLLPWMVCGTDLIGVESAAKLSTRQIVIWAKHGVLAAGSSLQAVMGVVESVDKASQTLLLTAELQDFQGIADHELQQLAEHFSIEPEARFFQ